MPNAANAEGEANCKSAVGEKQPRRHFVSIHVEWINKTAEKELDKLNETRHQSTEYSQAGRTLLTFVDEYQNTNESGTTYVNR